MGDLKGKTALITGGGRGIGRGIALELASAGADVFVTHLLPSCDRQSAGKVVTEGMALGRRAFTIAMDIADPSSVSAGLNELFSRTDTLDILVNNAGVMQHRAGLETSAEDFDRCYAVNVKGIWFLAHQLTPRLKAQGGGKIVNICSTAGRRGTAELPAYCASKAAVISLTQVMALALAPYDINVNAVCPGIVWTQMSEQFARLIDRRGTDETFDMQQFLEPIRQTIPLRRIPTGEDIGRAVVFFASDRAKNITGQALNVDGGYVMS
jgi:NAD(P)-dependent dehydrogenase (short-subunit alcohol dehydrogenase family)